MFNKSWIYLAVVLIVLGLIFGVRALLVIAAFIATVMPAAAWWNRHSLDGIAYRRNFATQSISIPTDGRLRAFPGEVVDLTLRVTNRKLLPLSWLAVQDQWSLALPLEEGHLVTAPSRQDGYYRTVLSARWFEQVSRRCRVRCTRRGFYPFGPVRFASGDIFGLFQQERVQDGLDWLIVYPQVVSLEALGFPPKEPLGETKAHWRVFEDPSRAVGIRDHQPQDSFRHIHWKATARRQDLQVKVYEPTTTHNLAIFLNVATFARYWEGIKPLLLEQAISVAASIACHAVEQRYILGLLANGTIPHSDQPIKVLPSRRPDQLARVLEALAAVTSFATTSIEALLLAESPRLPWGATLAVVTGVVTDELLATLTRLRDVGRRLVLVSLEDEYAAPFTPPPRILTHRLSTRELPFDENLLGEPHEWAPDFTPPVLSARSDR
jgi:uncharacterized protein (DUF58 family)